MVVMLLSLGLLLLSTTVSVKCDVPARVVENRTTSTLPVDCAEQWKQYLITGVSLTRAYQECSGCNWKGYTTTSYATNYFASMKSYGPGRMYTTCDGIARFQFTGPITSSETMIVTAVTASEEIVATNEIGTYWPGGFFSMFAHVTQTPLCPPPSGFCERMYYLNEIADSMLEEERSTAYYNPFACPTSTRCSLDMGAEVVLFYWPSTIKSRDVCNRHDERGITMTAPGASHPVVATVTEITFQGQNIWSVQLGTDKSGKEIILGKRVPSSTLTGNWTFTSPTIYLAHHAVTMDAFTASVNDTSYFTQGWGDESSVFAMPVEASVVARRGPATVSAGVLTLKAEDVYSLRPISQNSGRLDGLEYARSIAKGQFMPPKITNYDRLFGQWETRPFDFGDLKDPVPASLFYDARKEDCWGSQSHCATITDGDYRPQISIHNTAWSPVFPEGFVCSLPALDDPPIALVPISDHTTQVRSLPLFQLAQPTPESGHIIAQSGNEAIPVPRQGIGASYAASTISAWPAGRTSGQLDSFEGKPPLQQSVHSVIDSTENDVDNYNSDTSERPTPTIQQTANILGGAGSVIEQAKSMLGQSGAAFVQSPNVLKGPGGNFRQPADYLEQSGIAFVQSPSALEGLGANAGQPADDLGQMQRFSSIGNGQRPKGETWQMSRVSAGVDTERFRSAYERQTASSHISDESLTAMDLSSSSSIRKKSDGAHIISPSYKLLGLGTSIWFLVY